MLLIWYFESCAKLYLIYELVLMFLDVKISTSFVWFDSIWMITIRRGNIIELPVSNFLEFFLL